MATLVQEDGSNVLGANSYTSVAFADAYFSVHPFYADNWDGLDAAVKANLLIYATSQLDALVPWPGIRTYATQSLALPRVGLVQDGVEIPSVTIPLLVQQAVCEMAVYLNFPYANPDAASTTGIDELKIDVIQLKFSGSTTRPALPAAVVRLLRGLTAGQISSKIGRIVVRV